MLTVVLVMLMLPSVVLGGEVDEITILHTNDTHSRIEAGKYAGMGFAKISSLINDYRSQSENVLVLDAGDTFHGQTIANLVKGESVVKVLNAIGYDAMVPGNHDFNYGQQRLLELDQMADFPILAANVKKGSETVLQPYLIKNVAGLKVVIFGLATPETTYKTHPKNVEGLTFEDPVKVAKAMVNQFEDKADLIIALSHLGISHGSNYTSKKVDEEVSGIDIIVDGHSHSKLDKGLQVNDTLIVMAGEYDKNLGVVKVTVEDGQIKDKKVEMITKDQTANLNEDKKILDLVAEIKEKNREITSVVVGEAAVLLDGERGHVRTGETNMGNLITDAMLAAVDADCAITNGGGIRASISEGEITKGDVITVLPFGNFTIVKEISGSDILEAIEHGISAYPATEGKFPQVGGISFVFDPTRPAGERVLNLKIAGRAIDYNKTYKVATNDFMAAGGDGYTMFADSPTVQEAGGLEEVVINFIKEKGTVKPEVEGRIISVEKDGEYYKYQVQNGDVLSAIANLFDTSVDTIVDVNELEDANTIIVGQELLIPIK